MKQQGNRKRVHAFLSVYPHAHVVIVTSPTRGTVFHPRMPCRLWMDTVFHPRFAVDGHGVSPTRGTVFHPR
jgi:hypothetical protein